MNRTSIRHGQVGPDITGIISRPKHYSRLDSYYSPSSPAPKLHDVRRWYALYGALLFFFVAVTFTFWAIPFSRPILFPYNFGLWLRANQKYATIFFTIVGALIAALVVYLLNRILILMSKQMISSGGTTLSSVEFWNRMYNKDFIFDGRRIELTLLTLAFWVAALYLGTAYTSLLTPTDILVSDNYNGTEIDFNSHEFWDWYNFQHPNGTFNRTVVGCRWYTYKANGGSTTFPTCPYNNDPINFLYAGASATQYGISTAKPAVNYLDRRYEGHTGGTLPVGVSGFRPFSDLKFESWDQNTRFPSYNYTLTQQGLTAEVSCKATTDTIITYNEVGQVNTSIPGLEDGFVRLINFTYTCPNNGCVASSDGACNKNGGSAQTLQPRLSQAQLFVCMSPNNAKEFTFYIGAFGTYATDTLVDVTNFPNMTCTLKPKLATAVVKYTSSDSLFKVKSLEMIPDSGNRIPNETYQAIDRAFSLAVSNSENMVIDSVYGFVSTNTSVPVTKAMEETMKGYIEYFGTNLRMYYAANEPPGRCPVNGNYTVWRVGYKGQPVVLASLAPPLLLITGLAVTYIILGIRTGTTHVPTFDPIDSLSMVVASAAGGGAGKFPITGHSTSPETESKRQLGMRVKYDQSDGQMVVVPAADVAGGDNVRLSQMPLVPGADLPVPGRWQGSRHSHSPSLSEEHPFIGDECSDRSVSPMPTPDLKRESRWSAWG